MAALRLHVTTIILCISFSTSLAGIECKNAIRTSIDSNYESVEVNLPTSTNSPTALDGHEVTDLSDDLAGKNFNQKKEILSTRLKLFENGQKEEALIVIRYAGNGLYHWEAWFVSKTGTGTDWKKSDSGLTNVLLPSDWIKSLFNIFRKSHAPLGKVKVRNVDSSALNDSLIFRLNLSPSQLGTFKSSFIQSVANLSISCTQSACRVLVGQYAASNQTTGATPCLTCGPNLKNLLEGNFRLNGQPISFKIYSTSKKSNWKHVISSTTQKAIITIGAVATAFTLIIAVPVAMMGPVKGPLAAISSLTISQGITNAITGIKNFFNNRSSRSN